MVLKSKQTVVVVVLVSFTVVGGFMGLAWWKERTAWPDGLIQANGRIEGDLISVATKFTGRVEKLFVREGDTVTIGQTMVQLDDVQTRAKVEQSRQAWMAHEAQVEATHTDLAILNLEVPLSIEGADAKVREFQAKVNKAVAVEQEAKSELNRVRRLYENRNTSLQELQESQRKWDVARYEISAARSALIQAKKESAQAELGWKRIRAKEGQVEVLERLRDQAEAVLEEFDSVLADMTITAPSNGTITTRIVDVGEMVSAGAPLFEIVDLGRLYLKVYVPEVQIGKVRLNLSAQIYTDAFPEKAFPAVVRYISSRAEFTPKEVQTPDERVKLTYAVKLYLEANPDHRLSPGMPADAVIRWQEDIAWRKPQW